MTNLSPVRSSFYTNIEHICRYNAQGIYPSNRGKPKEFLEKAFLVIDGELAVQQYTGEIVQKEENVDLTEIAPSDHREVIDRRAERLGSVF